MGILIIALQSAALSLLTALMMNEGGKLWTAVVILTASSLFLNCIMEVMEWKKKKKRK